MEISTNVATMAAKIYQVSLTSMISEKINPGTKGLGIYEKNNKK